MQKHYSLKKRFLCLSLLIGIAFMALLTSSCLLSLRQQLELTNLGYQREIDWLSEKLIQETTDTAYQLIKLSTSNESLMVLATNPNNQRIDYHRVTVGTLFKNLLAELNYINGLFLVCPDTNTILVYHPTVLPSEKEKLETAVPLILEQRREQLSFGRWNLIEGESGPLLLYVIRVYDAYLGAILTENSFDKLFASTEVDERIESRALLSGVPVWLYRNLYNESDHYYRITSALPVSGKLQLQLEWLIPASLYQSQLLRTAWPILLVALIAAVLIPTLIYYVYAIMLKPLKQMTAVMECIRSSDTLVKMDLGRSADEYQNIARTFNNMIDRIFNLQDSLSQKEIEKRDIQLSYLKLQINPHFYTLRQGIYRRALQRGYYPAGPGHRFLPAAGLSVPHLQAGNRQDASRLPAGETDGDRLRPVDGNILTNRDHCQRCGICKPRALFQGLWAHLPHDAIGLPHRAREEILTVFRACAPKASLLLFVYLPAPPPSDLSGAGSRRAFLRHMETFGAAPAYTVILRTHLPRLSTTRAGMTFRFISSVVRVSARVRGITPTPSQPMSREAGTGTSHMYPESSSVAPRVSPPARRQ